MVLNNTSGMEAIRMAAESLGSGDAAIKTKSLSGLVNVAYDYIGVTYPTSSTEVYTYKTGGSGGVTAAILTVTYTDSTKAVLTSVART